MQTPPHGPVVFSDEENFTIPQYTPRRWTWQRILSLFLQAIVGAYGISVTMSVILWVLFGDSLTWLAFFNTFAHIFWILAIILLLACLVLRRWGLSLTLIVPVIACITTYGVQFTSRYPVVSDDMIHFSLMTYNLHAETARLDELILFVQEQNPDIVLFQELSVAAAEYFAPRLAAYYPYQALHPNAEDSTAGGGVFSRLPLTSDEFWQYDFLPKPLGHQRVSLQTGGVPLVIYNVHTTHPGMSGSLFNPANRGREIDDLLRRVGEESAPVILAGDFNASDLTSDYAHITTQLTDSYRARGWGMGFTFPNKPAGDLPILSGIPLLQNLMMLPFLRLDYVFYTDGLRALDAVVLDGQRTSDHLPLLVRLALDASE